MINSLYIIHHPNLYLRRCFGDWSVSPTTVKKFFWTQSMGLGPVTRLLRYIYSEIPIRAQHVMFFQSENEDIPVSETSSEIKISTRIM